MLKVYNKLNRNQLKALEEYRTIQKTRRYVFSYIFIHYLYTLYTFYKYITSYIVLMCYIT